MLELGHKVSWDSAEVGSPVVKRFIGNNRRKVVVHVVRTMEGRLINTDTSDSIGLAVSSNGIHW